VIILDRFEGEIVVLEKDCKFFNVSINEVSPLAKEGDILILQDGIYTPDKVSTDKRKRELEERFGDLWE